MGTLWEPGGWALVCERGKPIEAILKDFPFPDSGSDLKSFLQCLRKNQAISAALPSVLPETGPFPA